MKELTLNEVIHNARLEKGLTLEKLSEGIMELETLSRIENGWHSPKEASLRALLERLDLPATRFFAPAAAARPSLVEAREELTELLRVYRWAPDTERAHFQAQIKEKLHSFSQQIDSEDIVSEQFRILAASVAGIHRPSFGAAKEEQRLIDGIRLSDPSFSPEQNSNRVYNLDEFQLLLRLGAHYLETRRNGQALLYFQNLYAFVEEKKDSLSPYARYGSPAAYYLSSCLYESGEYEKAMTIADQGRRDAVYYVYSAYLPGLLLVEARCAHRLRDDLHSILYYLETYYLSVSIGDRRTAHTAFQEITAGYPNQICVEGDLIWSTQL